MCDVSVLMPVYNAEKYLAEAIDSIIAQSYTNWELILINDGSTDSSEAIILSYADRRIKYHKNEQNIGLIDTLNKGIDLCKGKYIARMDADDIAMPDRLKNQVALMNHNTELVLCGTNALVIDNDGNKTGEIINTDSNTLLQISLLFTNPFIHPSVLIRKEALDNLRYNKQAIHIEDYELWTKIAGKGKLANISQPLLKYRWHDTNVSVKHADTQEQLKDQLIESLIIEKLQLHPTPEELRLHRLTFQLYRYGQKRVVDVEQSQKLKEWFKKLSSQNRQLETFPTADFDAFLWSRWMVLCVFMGEKSKMFFPKFIPFSLSTLFKTIKLALYLSKK